MKQYVPLYLKYRPQKLSELIGQEVVTKTLSNAITYNKIVHAYLFCGPRGTGKTSTARILAKSLNCEKGITTDPCDKCLSCRSIIQGNSLDVIEIDAASHRKVEDAEDLINRVALGTYGSRFKIYIIDEVHMLTDHAFNALLKTLEEPPKNVIFILATTEEHKVIPTIVSRCQRLDFKPVFKKELEERIKYIAKEEKIVIDETAIKFISKRSSGCLRDAISLLDQISVLQDEDKSIDPKEVFTLFGTVDRTSLFNLLQAVLLFDRQNAVNLAEDFVKSGMDLGELFKSLIELLIDLTKAKIDLNYKKALENELGKNLEVLEKVKHSHLLKIIDRLHASQSELRFALSQELQFMTSIMSMLDEDFLVSFSELQERIEVLEHRSTAAPQHRGAAAPEELSTEVLELPSPRAAEPRTSGAILDLDSMWLKIISLVESNPTKTLLHQSGSYLISLTDSILEVGIEKDMFLPRLKNDAKKQEMILKATKLASSINAKEIRFKVLPKPQKEPVESDSSEETLETKITKSEIKLQAAPPGDEFAMAIKDLLGAREIE